MRTADPVSLRKEKGPVLAVDADANSNLNEVLGVDGIHLYALNKWKDVSEIIDRSGLRTLI